MKKQKNKKGSEARKRLAEQFFKNRCFYCHRKYGKGFTIHHLGYLPDGQDVKYSDYNDTEKYNVALEKVILDDPERFALLCRKHHFLAQWIDNMDDDMFDRIVELRERSKAYNGKT